jgi:hypothetical protein
MVIINVPTRHLYSRYGTKTTLLHLLPTSSKVRSSMRSVAELVMGQPLVKVVLIFTLVTILKLVNHTAILDTHINFLLVMSMAVNKQRTFLPVSMNS